MELESAAWDKEGNEPNGDFIHNSFYALMFKKTGTWNDDPVNSPFWPITCFVCVWDNAKSLKIQRGNNGLWRVNNTVVGAGESADRIRSTTIRKGAVSFKCCSKDEIEIIGDANVREVICRKNIIFAVPDTQRDSWYEESGITSSEQMADWLEEIYLLTVEWTGYDPNQHYAKKNGKFIRLIFVDNGKKDFVFSGKRPFIGLVDLRRDKHGTDVDRLGWLTHELSHDFWHINPKLQVVKNPWGEGMCDFNRYWLLFSSGMPEAAERWKSALITANPKDKYRGAAWRILKYQLDNFKSPKAFWKNIYERDFDKLFGKPEWE